LALVLLFANPSYARKTFTLGGKPLSLQGYFSQSYQYGLEDDVWDTEDGLNAVISNLFVEGDYKLSSDWRLYGAVGVTGDLIYQINDGGDWDRKGFGASENSLNVNDEWWQVLREFHLTWDPGKFFLRLGKQRVGWGEMEVFAVNDLFNPLDSTRGLSETELDTLFVPIPLIRGEYTFDDSGGKFSNVNLQFIFNPNVDFISNQGTFYGNDAAGIWAVDFLDFSLVDVLGFPLRIGRQDADVVEPDAFDSDSFEYGLRLSGLMGSNTLVSLMGFYGTSNTAVSTFGAGLTDDSFTVFDDDGIPVVNFNDVGFHPRQKFVGFALATQLPIKSKALGGYEPVVRLEGSYQVDNQFFDFTSYDFVKSNQFIVGLNLDYKIRVPWQRQFLYLFVEGQYNDLMDYESGWDLSSSGVYQKDFWNLYAFLSTGYLRGELEPSISWYALDTAGAQIWTPALTYYLSDTWQFALKANLFTGPDIQSQWGLHNKDHLVFNVQFQF
jgi:hypothetical protein